MENITSIENQLQNLSIHETPSQRLLKYLRAQLDKPSDDRHNAEAMKNEVEVLFKANCKDEQNWTPLHLAVALKAKAIANLILDQSDIAINAKTAHGATVIDLAVRYQTPEILNAILDKYPKSVAQKPKKPQPQLTTINEIGDTILHELAASDSDASNPMLEKLCSFFGGKKVVKANSEGVTPVMIAFW